MKRFFVALTTLGWLTTTAVHSGTNGFVVPFIRGSNDSQAGYWETFTIPIGLPGNAADQPGATTSARLVQTDPQAFLTGSGNLYNQEGLSRFSLTDSAPFTLGTAVLQVRSLGSELDYPSATLTCSNAAGVHVLSPHTAVELNRAAVPGLGATVSTLWQWDLSGLGVSAYEIRFAAAAPSLSLDSLTLDTAAAFIPLFTAPFAIANHTPTIERWMYPHNAAPCDRPAGASFGTFGDEAGVDTRHAQHLVGWDTAAWLPVQRGPASYLITRGRVTLTINRGNLFPYDPTHDPYETYLDPGIPGAVPDADAGRPVELFGVGYRSGFDLTSFDQCSPFGSDATGERNAYAASWSTNGAWVDVSNNVGKTNTAFAPFDAVPFAVGQTADAPPGELVPTGAKLTFELNLADPFVLGYVQAGLNAGRLRFLVSSLHTTDGPTGTPTFPDFATRFNAAVVEPTQLELEGLVVGTDDLDADGLPDDWELHHLQSLTYGAADDPDQDGAANGTERHAGTDPANAEDRLSLSVGIAQQDGRTLRWRHQASRTYTLETTVDWQNWQPVPAPALRYPKPGIVDWTDDGSLTGGLGPLRFYRVSVKQP